MVDFKEENSEVSVTGRRKINDDADPLDRQSALNAPGIKKKGYGYLGLILMGLVALVLLFFNAHDKPKDGFQKEAVEFEPAPKRQIILPETPPSLPIPKVSIEDPKEAALKAARLKSAIVVYGNSNSNASKPSATDTPTDGSGDHNTRFQQDVGNAEVQRVAANDIGALDKKILQGKMIDAVLETALNSDLPGMVRAVVSHDVYAESGDQVLIPKGARLLGQYNSQVTKGQSRVFVIWTRVIRPDGIDVALNSGGTDTLGRAGMGGSVNRHFWQIFGTSTLLSIIGAGAANAGVNPTDQFNSTSAYRQQIAEGFQNTATNTLSNNLNIPPTIKVKQGTLVKVFVARDLDFSDVLNGKTSSNIVMIQ